MDQPEFKWEQWNHDEGGEEAEETREFYCTDEPSKIEDALDWALGLLERVSRGESENGDGAAAIQEYEKWRDA